MSSFKLLKRDSEGEGGGSEGEAGGEGGGTSEDEGVSFIIGVTDNLGIRPSGFLGLGAVVGVHTDLVNVGIESKVGGGGERSNGLGSLDDGAGVVSNTGG